MKVYYAHCLSLYNTPQEKRDLMAIERLGMQVLNPNSPEVDEAIAALQVSNPDAVVLDVIFQPLVESCDVLVFRALPDGRIGVAKEIAWAQAAGIPVVEFPSGVLRRSIDVEETREYLREVGQR